MVDVGSRQEMVASPVRTAGHQVSPEDDGRRRDQQRAGGARQPDHDRVPSRRAYGRAGQGRIAGRTLPCARSTLPSWTRSPACPARASTTSSLRRHPPPPAAAAATQRRPARGSRLGWPPGPEESAPGAPLLRPRNPADVVLARRLAACREVTAYDNRYRPTATSLTLPSDDPLVTSGAVADPVTSKTGYYVDGSASSFKEPAAGPPPNRSPTSTTALACKPGCPGNPVICWPPTTRLLARSANSDWRLPTSKEASASFSPTPTTRARAGC